MKDPLDKHNMIYTIGHSNNKIDDFMNLLLSFKIEMVLDVRSYPYSKYNPQFNGKTIAQTLSNSGIAYEYLGDCLGGRPRDPTCYKAGKIPEGKANYLELVDYEEVSKRDWYIKGIYRLIELAKTKRIALMCSEEDPNRCHRHHLIAKTLVNNQMQIGHIRRDCTVQELPYADHEQISTESKLTVNDINADMEKSFPVQQLHLFEIGKNETLSKNIKLDGFNHLKNKCHSDSIRLYTIGFTQKSAKKFFSLLEENGVQRLIDIRLNPKGQLAGFTKKDDLSYFLNKILDCEYHHWETLAPTKEILSEYRTDKNWNKYTISFELLMDKRNIPESLDYNFFKNKVCCLMCSEEKPIKCHRRLVAERISKYWPNIKIIHLI